MNGLLCVFLTRSGETVPAVQTLHPQTVQVVAIPGRARPPERTATPMAREEEAGTTGRTTTWRRGQSAGGAAGGGGELHLPQVPGQQLQQPPGGAGQNPPLLRYRGCHGESSDFVAACVVCRGLCPLHHPDCRPFVSTESVERPNFICRVCAF